ncbi:nucleotidyltransferase domain-containing protein [Azospirillum sp. YIM B02556]|uniref:Nucleotidyltransferase domain-containing protein n=1 Tax=Azospirillum endophyticum TaxID=2800326 RepID=A0ABS1FCX2_9PROT|nr:nucleotidyltransferase domain-containing protein [Azospirillum endophyticum]MBK1841282.1 nucleotidyltransferase domain-containing protein [Azospirillum endophyticum]
MGAIDTEHDEKLQLLLDRIVPALEPEAVYLFGSRARGDFDEDSDYDLLVIVPDDAPKERRSIRYAYEANSGTGIPADVLPCSRTSFERYKDSVGTLCYEANHNGVRVYGH